MKIIPCGIDLGNRWLKVCLLNKCAKIPAAYAFQCPPGEILPSGLEAKIKAFMLLIASSKLWFGLDILGGPVIQEMDDTKYDENHIAILFRAVLYAWSQRWKIDLSEIGKLSVVVSMPPGSFSDRRLNKQAETAYRKAFNRGQSHLQIRDGKASVQIITQFGGLQREAVSTIASISRPNAFTLLVDIGSGTIDYALFNGGSKPILSKSDNDGLIHAFDEINPHNANLAELEVLRDKKNLPPQIKIRFNTIKNRIVKMRRQLPQPIEKIAIIGGGAALMTPQIQSTFKQLAPDVIIKKDAEYQNAIANWRAAGGKLDAN